MANIKVTLSDGLELDGVKQLEAELKEPTVADIMACQEASEVPVLTPDDGYQMVSSRARMANLMLARQIVRIGERKGPLPVEELKKLSPRDYKALNKAAIKLEETAFKEVAQRGRTAA